MALKEVTGICLVSHRGPLSKLTVNWVETCRSVVRKIKVSHPRQILQFLTLLRGELKPSFCAGFVIIPLASEVTAKPTSVDTPERDPLNVSFVRRGLSVEAREKLTKTSILGLGLTSVDIVICVLPAPGTGVIMKQNINANNQRRDVPEIHN